MLLEWKCKACGGNIKIDSNQKHGQCPYCGREYTEQEIINIYNTYKITVDENGLDNQLSNAYVYLEAGSDYDKATVLFNNIVQVYAHDYRGWYGLLKSKTHNFGKFIFTDTEFQEIVRVYNYCIAVAPNSQRERIINEWNEYCKKRKNYIDYKTQIRSTNNASIKNLRNNREDVMRKIKEIDKHISHLNKMYNNPKALDLVSTNKYIKPKILEKKYFIALLCFSALFSILFIIFLCLANAPLISGDSIGDSFTLVSLFSVFVIPTTIVVIIYLTKRRNHSRLFSYYNAIEESKKEKTKLEGELSRINARIIELEKNDSILYSDQG